MTLTALLLAFAGVVLPGLPGTPFVLLAAASARRGWPQLEAWLLAHPRHGQAIRNWRERRAIPRAAKRLAILGMGFSAALTWITPLPIALKLALPLVLLAVGAWIWSRPDE